MRKREGVELNTLHECWFCGNFVEEDALCFGCGVYICDECCPAPIEGKHEPEGHMNFIMDEANEVSYEDYLTLKEHTEASNKEEPFENIRFEGE